MTKILTKAQIRYRDDPEFRQRKKVRKNLTREQKDLKKI